jgi:hypothetical protein
LSRTADDCRLARIRLAVPLGTLAAGLLCSSGCGLSDYEKKMEEAQQAQRRFEEAANLLERTPLQLPDKKGSVEGGEGALSTLFGFRPPRGISTTPEKRRLGSLGVYRSTSDASGFKEVLAGASKSGERQGFQHDVLEQLGVSGTARSKEVKQPGGKVVSFEYYEKDAEQQSTRVYFCQAGPYQIAIAFRIAAGSNWSGVESKIDASLATLGI